MAAAHRFLLILISLFFAFYGFHIGYIALTSPGGLYIPFLDEHCNYIRLWRDWYISISAEILEFMGYTVYTSSTTLKVHGHSGFRLVYSCLGYGILSFISAFVLSFPKPFRAKLRFLFTITTTVLTLNLCRFVLIPIYYSPKSIPFSLNHHDLFNVILYLIIALMMHHWINAKST